MSADPDTYALANSVVRLHATLAGIEPAISRTLDLPRTLNLSVDGSRVARAI